MIGADRLAQLRAERDAAGRAEALRQQQAEAATAMGLARARTLGQHLAATFLTWAEIDALMCKRAESRQPGGLCQTWHLVIEITVRRVHEMFEPKSRAELDAFLEGVATVHAAVVAG